MASVFDSQGKHDKALEFFGKSLAIKLGTPCETHPSTATTFENIGMAHFKLGNKVKAKENLQRAAQIFIAALGPDHPITKACLEQLHEL